MAFEKKQDDEEKIEAVKAEIKMLLAEKKMPTIFRTQMPRTVAAVQGTQGNETGKKEVSDGNGRDLRNGGKKTGCPL